MSILAIDEAVQAAITKACKLAREDVLHITNEEELKLAGLSALPPGSTIKLSDRPPEWNDRIKMRQNVIIPFGFRAAIGYEMQPKPLELCAHLSLSAPTAGRIPNQASLMMVAKAFGMLKVGSPRHLWLEEFEPGWHAVNLVEPVQWPPRG